MDAPLVGVDMNQVGWFYASDSPSSKPQFFAAKMQTNFSISTLTISIQEKQELVKELKSRAVLKIIIELMLLAALLCTSKIFADNEIYGLAQSLTIGMMGFIGTLIGSELYAIRHLPKLC